jgi:hypothetical protein
MGGLVRGWIRLGLFVVESLCLRVLKMFRCLPGREEVARVVFRVLEEELGCSR